MLSLEDKKQKIVLDFHAIPTGDPKILKIQDNSYWGIIKDKPAILEVIVAGDKYPVTLPFYHNETHNINSFNLGYNCPDGCSEFELIDLPDGVYEITLKGSPDKYRKTRKILRTEKLELEINKIFINLTLSCVGDNMNDNLIKRLYNIRLMLDSARANVIYDNICKANELLNRIWEEVGRLKNCKNCI